MPATTPIPAGLMANSNFVFEWTEVTKGWNDRGLFNYIVYINKLRKLCVLPLDGPYTTGVVNDLAILCAKFEEEAFVLSCVIQGMPFHANLTGDPSKTASFTEKEMHFLHHDYFVESFLQDADFRKSQTFFVVLV